MNCYVESPGLVVMGGESFSVGCVFESQHRVLHRHFFSLYGCKNYHVCSKRQKMNEKEAGMAYLFKKKIEPVIVEFLSDHDDPNLLNCFSEKL